MGTTTPMAILPPCGNPDDVLLVLLDDTPLGPELVAVVAALDDVDGFETIVVEYDVFVTITGAV